MTAEQPSYGDLARQLAESVRRLHADDVRRLPGAMMLADVSMMWVIVLTRLEQSSAAAAAAMTTMGAILRRESSSAGPQPASQSLRAAVDMRNKLALVEKTDAFCLFALGDLLRESVAAAELARRQVRVSPRPLGARQDALWTKLMSTLASQPDEISRVAAVVDARLRVAANQLISHPEPDMQGGTSSGPDGRTTVLGHGIPFDDARYQWGWQTLQDINAGLRPADRSTEDHWQALADDLVRRADRLNQKQRERLALAIRELGAGAVPHEVAHAGVELVTLVVAALTTGSEGATG